MDLIKAAILKVRERPVVQVAPTEEENVEEHVSDLLDIDVAQSDD